MENHETIEQLLIDFALGQLPQDQHEQIQRHLEECDSCTQQLKKLRDLLLLTERIRSSSASDDLC
jgi:anti-sigma factor RsiW